jgi:pyruvate carboxylase
MKMETHVAAERDAEIEAVLIAPGDRVQAKDLLIVLKAVA